MSNCTSTHDIFKHKKSVEVFSHLKQNKNTCESYYIDTYRE